MLKMTFFWLLFRGKFEQKTQKSISFKNQWRLKNIKKAMIVKNIIAEDMPFTKSVFEQFWRSYCKKTIFVVFHFLKFLPQGIFLHAMIRVVQKANFSMLMPWRQPIYKFTILSNVGHMYELRNKFSHHDLVISWPKVYTYFSFIPSSSNLFTPYLES